MANINALIAQGVEPIQLEDPMNQMAKVYKVKALQQEMAARDQAMAEQNALRDFLRSNPDISSQEALNRLTTGFGKTGLEYGTKLQDLAAKRFEAQTKQWKMVEDKTNYFRDSLAGVNTPEDARAWTAAIYSDPDVGPVAQRMGGSLEQAVAKVPNDPQGFAAWRQQAALGAKKFIELSKPHFINQNLGGYEQTLAVPGLGGEAKVVEGSRSLKTMAPGEAARIGLESQRVGLDRARLGLEAQRVGIAQQEAARAKGPEGKPLTAGQEIKLRQDIGKDRKMLGAIESNSESISKEIDRLLKHKGLSGITGAAGVIPTLPFTEAGGAKNILEGIQGKIKTLGRDIASQSGKLGNMAVQEWKFVADAVAALDPRSPDFMNQLENVKSTMKGLEARTKSQFEDTYAPYLEQRPELAQPAAKPAAATAKPAAQAAAMYARNPKTGERIMSIDGGNTWSPAR